MNDREIICRIQNGEKEYISEIVASYYDDIFRFCMYQTGNEANSYDLVQETFLRFIKYVESYKYGNLKGYLITIAKNLCRDYYQNSGTTVNFDSVSELGEEDVGISQIDNRLMLCCYLQKIPLKQRETIILHYYSNFKIKEISIILGVNISTVKSRLRLGILNLKKAMGEE